MSKIPDWAISTALEIVRPWYGGAESPQCTARAEIIALALVAAEKRGIERAAVVSEMHDHRGDIAAAIRQLGERHDS